MRALCVLQVNEYSFENVMGRVETFKILTGQAGPGRENFKM